MTDIEKMLQLNSQLEKNDAVSKPTQNRFASQSDLDRLIENLDQQVYGEPTNQPMIMEDGRKKYDPEEEMKRLKEIEEKGHGKINVEGRKIPRNILESIINNPLDMPVIDPQMDVLENKLKENMTGIKKAANIVSKIDKQEQEARQKLNEQLTPRVSGNIDYDTIKTIIENVIDEKLSQINEMIAHSNNNVPSAALMSFKDKFLFVDSDDNVFECIMKYKGKKKRKK